MTNELTAERLRDLVGVFDVLSNHNDYSAQCATYVGFYMLKHRHQIIDLIEREARMKEALAELQIYTCNAAGWIEQKLDARWASVCEMHEIIGTALQPEPKETDDDSIPRT